MSVSASQKHYVQRHCCSDKTGILFDSISATLSVASNEWSTVMMMMMMVTVIRLEQWSTVDFNENFTSRQHALKTRLQLQTDEGTYISWYYDNYIMCSDLTRVQKRSEARWQSNRSRQNKQLNDRTKTGDENKCVKWFHVLSASVIKHSLLTQSIIHCPVRICPTRRRRRSLRSSVYVNSTIYTLYRVLPNFRRFEICNWGRFLCEPKSGLRLTHRYYNIPVEWVEWTWPSMWTCRLNLSHRPICSCKSAVSTVHFYTELCTKSVASQPINWF